MRDQLDALEHAQECDGTTENGKPCKRGQETRTVKLRDGRKIKQNKHDSPDAWHNEDEANTAIREAQYGIRIKTGWYTPGEKDSAEAEEFEIILGGGGPASRVVGELTDGGPDSARYEFQDWFKPWTAADLTCDERETLLAWCRVHYFGEG